MKELIPDKKDLYSTKEVLSECEKRGISMSLRNLQIYVKKGILPQPIYFPSATGDRTFYAKGVILEEIRAADILKTTFAQTMAELQTLAKNGTGSLEDIVTTIESILDSLFKNYKEYFPTAKAPLFIYFDRRSNIPQRVVSYYLGEVKDGGDIRKLTAEEVITEAFEGIDQGEI